ncbi:hypothetical protein LIER_41517 [Lithospermum erythrorhizon]|uniref:Uncharacterized protein n=1 Tax=Lithospermum erythrorhizon TaxID=34254 RepID=A0AAV3RCK8_LITER
MPEDYLRLFDNLIVVDDFAWGAHTLAYLYRHLEMASIAEGKQIVGCLTLLEYFPLFQRRTSAVGRNMDPSRARRWSNIAST